MEAQGTAVSTATRVLTLPIKPSQAANRSVDEKRKSNQLSYPGVTTAIEAATRDDGDEARAETAVEQKLPKRRKTMGLAGLPQTGGQETSNPRPTPSGRLTTPTLTSSAATQQANRPAHPLSGFQLPAPGTPAFNALRAALESLRANQVGDSAYQAMGAPQASMLATPASKTLRASGGSIGDSQSGMRGIQGTMQASGKGSDVMSIDEVPVGTVRWKSG